MVVRFDSEAVLSPPMVDMLLSCYLTILGIKLILFNEDGSKDYFVI